MCGGSLPSPHINCMLGVVTCAEDGDAYIWGKLQGEGVDPEKGIQNDAVSPRRVEIPGRVVDVACGIAHVTYLTGASRCLCCPTHLSPTPSFPHPSHCVHTTAQMMASCG